MRTVLIYAGVIMGMTGFTASLHAQQVLEEYIQQGLQNNLAITARNLSLDKALNGLQVARNSYLPNFSFDATYSTANGGRAILLPVGDMLNPVYNTLNQLTQSQAFPQIDNENIHFLPRNYYDARLRAGIPVLNTDIRHNRHMSERLVAMQEHELEIYKRTLVSDIKVAYYQYLSAVDAVKIYENALNLAQEGKRVNQRLLEAGSGLPAYLVRADAEIAQNEAQLVEAQQQVANAQYYFNTLLNREADHPIRMEDTAPADTLTMAYTDSQVDKREELEALDDRIDIQETLVKMRRQVFVPKLNAFVDVGSQAENMQFNRQSQYVMIGAHLSFPIFEGNRNKLRIRESQIAVAEAKNQRIQAQQQLQLALRVAHNEVTSARKNYQTARQQRTAAATYQRLIQRGFSEGVNSYIETIDARTQFTNAQLAEQVSRYRWWVALARLERETAGYPLTK